MAKSKGKNQKRERMKTIMLRFFEQRRPYKSLEQVQREKSKRQAKEKAQVLAHAK